jgi:hypothetical protein
MRNAIRRLLRRRPAVVLVDAGTYRDLCAAVAVADAEEIVMNASEHWHNLDLEEHR